MSWISKFLGMRAPPAERGWPLEDASAAYDRAREAYESAKDAYERLYESSRRANEDFVRAPSQDTAKTKIAAREAVEQALIAWRRAEKERSRLLDVRDRLSYEAAKKAGVGDMWS